MENKCKYLDLIIEKGMLPNLLGYLYPVENSTMECAVQKVDIDDGGRYVVVAIFSTDHSSYSQERVFSLTDMTAYLFERTNNDIVDCSDRLHEFREKLQLGDDSLDKTNKTKAEVKANSKTPFLDELSLAELEKLVCQIITDGIIIGLDINKNESNLLSYEAEIRFRNQAWPGVLKFNDSTAEYFQNFRGSHNCSKRLQDIMLKRKNGVAYAKMLYDGEMQIAQDNYLERIAIHKKHQEKNI